MKIQLSSITCPVQTPTATTGESKTATYYRGDPEFDIYEQRGAAFREKVRRMIYQENGLPKNFLGAGSEGTSLSGAMLGLQMKEVFVNFFRGQIDESALETAMSDIIADLRSSYVDKGYDEAEFMLQLIEDTYEVARLDVVLGAGSASWYAGRSIAAEHNGHEENTADWIYYDANFYYQSEEMKGTLQEITKRLAVKFGVNPAELNLPTEYPDGDIRKGIYSSYNTYMCDRARNVGGFGSIIDETMPPPEGLRFFYKSNESGTDKVVPKLPAPRDEVGAIFDGVLRVWYGDWSFIGRVPVRQDPSKFPISVNMFDVVSAGSKTPVPQEITGFLQNVDFFTMMMRNTYTNSHPRKI